MTDDRTPPHNLDAERAALGGMLLSKHAIPDVTDLLVPKDFYQPAHELIYTAILDLHACGDPVDAVTVSAELGRRGEIGRVGGVPYLHQLMGCVPTGANATYYAVIVREHSTRRRIIEAGTRIAQMGWETDDGSDLPAIVDRVQAEAFGLADTGMANEDPANVEVFDGMLGEIEHGVEHGVPTGFTDLDQLTRGLHPDQLIIIAARPAIGKSTLALDLVRSISIKHRHAAAFFSLEMNRTELIRRATSAEGRINLHHLAPNLMTDEDWRRAGAVRQQIVTAPIIIDDSPDLTVMRIRTKARRLKQRHDLRLIVVDYVQLMSSGAARKFENRQAEVSAISRGLKLLAKELHVPVVMVAQLNRGPEQRSDKRPMLSDLRESGSLEQDADVVILLHREDAYVQDSPRAGEADLIIAKHRNGPTATITVAFQGHFSRFVDMKQS
jgi:replicative DNA helicase